MPLKLSWLPPAILTNWDAVLAAAPKAMLTRTFPTKALAALDVATKINAHVCLKPRGKISLVRPPKINHPPQFDATNQPIF